MWIFVGFLEEGRQKSVVRSTTTIFIVCGGYFFANIRDKAGQRYYGDMQFVAGL